MNLKLVTFNLLKKEFKLLYVGTSTYFFTIDSIDITVSLYFDNIYLSDIGIYYKKISTYFSVLEFKKESDIYKKIHEIIVNATKLKK